MRIVLLAALLAASGGCKGGGFLVPPPDEPSASGVLSPGWSVRLHPTAWEDYHPQMFAQPVVDDLNDQVLVGTTNGVFYALEADSGSERWSYGPIGPISSRPLLLSAARRLYVGTEDGTVYSLIPRTGQLRWKFATKGPVHAAPAEATINGKTMVYVTNADDHVYALDPTTGKLNWEVERERPDQFTVQGHSGPTVVGDLVLAGFSDGRLAAYSATEGKLRWETDLSGGRTQFVDVDSTPIIDGDVVYVATAASGVFALTAATGELRWKFELEGAGPLAYDRGRIYATVPGELVVLTRDGRLSARHKLGKTGDPARPVVTGNYVFVSTADAGLFVIDRDSGALLQLFEPGPGVTAPPAVDGTRLFALSNGGVLYAFSLAR